MFRQIFYMMLLCIVASAYHTKNHKYREHLTQNDEDEYHSFDDFYDDNEDYKDSLRKIITSEDEQAFTEKINTDSFYIRPTNQYEVTENIIDIPNTEFISGPVITNFSLITPLNNATINNSLTNKLDRENAKNRYLSILHVTAYDDKPEVVQNINFNTKPNIIPHIKDYFTNLKKDLINGINSLVYKHIKEENVSVHENEVPVVFFNNIHNKGKDVVRNIHKALFGVKYE